MFSTALLVLSGVVFYFALCSAALGVGASGHWLFSGFMLIGTSLAGGLGWLLLLASHACGRWQDRRRRAGLMFVCVGVIPLSMALMFAIALLDPATIPLAAYGNPKTAAIALAVPLWRVAIASVVPTLVVVRGIGLIRSAPSEAVAPTAGFSSSAAESCPGRGNAAPPPPPQAPARSDPRLAHPQ